MSCAYDRDLLSLLVSDELSPEEAAGVRTHIRRCPECQAILAQYQAGAALLRRPPTAVPYRAAARPSRRSRPWFSAAAAAVILAAVTLAVSPEARAAALRLILWPVVRVQEQVIRWQVPGGGQADDANAIRQERWIDAGPGIRQVTRSLDEVRRLVGPDVLLPPEDPSEDVMVFRKLDKNQRLTYAYLEIYGWIESADRFGPRGWYEAYYWPGGDLAETSLAFGANWMVETEETEIGGRPARIISGRNPVTDEFHAEVWLYDGDWLYKLKSHDPAVPVERLLEAAASLR